VKGQTVAKSGEPEAKARQCSGSNIQTPKSAEKPLVFSVKQALRHFETCSLSIGGSRRAA
jgi:hypothetical protein